MGLIEASYTAVASSPLKKFLNPIFICADNNKSLINLGDKSLNPTNLDYCHPRNNKPPSSDHNLFITNNGVGESPISRALSQLLSLVNDVPVSSRKYEVVRSLAEKLIEENQEENLEVLHQVNRICLSTAFERTLSQLEAAMMELSRNPVRKNGGCGLVRFGLNRVLKMVRSIKEGTCGCVGRISDGGTDRSDEKLAAELLWLAQKLAACGFVEEAASRWAAASNLGRLALSAEPRVQGLLVKVSAFMFKQAKYSGTEETEEGEKEEQREARMNMLMSWVPLLCRAGNGGDIPVLCSSERAELERILEELIRMLHKQEDQEQVLSLWLHHFIYSSANSDWPNLQASYNYWCTTSRLSQISK